MRDLKECQAEVFRRSEQRIQARKRKYKQMLAVCVPLCLVLALWSATHFPEAGLDGSAESQAATTVDDTNNSIVLDYAMVEVQKRITYKEGSARSGTSTRDEIVCHNITCYDIVCTDEQGNKTVYHLNKNILVNTQTHQTVILTSEELRELKTDLRITD